MAYNLDSAGTTLTQTGTETNLSGFTGITGVTTVTDGIKTIYTLTNLRLKVEGTLTINPRIEKLVFDGTTGPIATNNGILYLDGGTLNIDGVETINGVDIYSEAEAIRFNRVTGDGGDADLITFNDATLNWSGGKIYADGRIATHSSNSGGALNITNGILDGDIGSRAEKRFMIRNGLVLNVNGFILKKAYLNIGAGTNITNLLGLETYGVAGGAVFQEQRAEAGRIDVRDYQGFGNDFDFGGWTNGEPNFIDAINNVSGSDITVGSSKALDTDFGISIFKEVSFNLADDGGAIEDARVFTRDYDDGNRHNILGNDFRGDRTYNWTTDNSGVSGINQVLIAEQYGKVKSNDMSYRSKNNDDSDLFDFYIWSYKHNSKKVELNLKGAGVLTYSTELFTDSNITELDRAVVAAYTGIAITHPTYNASGNVTARGSINITEDYNLNQLYDFVKYDKTLEASIEFPNISETAISVNATELRLHEDYDLVGIENLSSSDKFDKVTATGSISNTSGNTDEPLLHYEDSDDATFEIVNIPDNSEITVAQTNSGSNTEILHLDATNDIASRFVAYKKASSDIAVKVKYGGADEPLVSDVGTYFKFRSINVTTTPIDDFLNKTDTDYTNALAKATLTINASDQIQLRKQGSNTVLTRVEASLILDKYTRANNISHSSLYSRVGNLVTLAKELNTDIDLSGWDTIILPASQSGDLGDIAQIVASSPLKAGTDVICSFSATNEDYSIYGTYEDGTEAFSFEKISGTGTKVVVLPENTEIRVGISKAYHNTQVHSLNTGQGITRSYTLEANNKVSENDTYTVGAGQNIELSNPTNGTVQFGLADLVFSNTTNYKAVLSRAMAEEEYLKASTVSNNDSILIVGDTGQANSEITFQPLTASRTETKYYISRLVSEHVLYTAHSSNNKISVDVDPNINVIKKDDVQFVTDTTTARFEGILEEMRDLINQNTDTKTSEIKSETDKIDNMKSLVEKVSGLIEDDGSGNDRFSVKSLENAPTAEMDETELHTSLDNYANKDDWKATGGTTLSTEQQAALTKLNDITTGTGADTKLTVKALEDAPNSTELGDIPSKITAIKAKTDKLTFDANDRINSVAKVVEDKTGFALTTSQISDLAVAIETAIIDESDGQKVIEAIVNAIGNENVTATAIATAVWGSTSRELTSPAGLTDAQEEKMDNIKSEVDKVKLETKNIAKNTPVN